MSVTDPKVTPPENSKPRNRVYWKVSNWNIWRDPLSATQVTNFQDGDVTQDMRTTMGQKMLPLKSRMWIERLVLVVCVFLKLIIMIYKVITKIERKIEITWTGNKNCQKIAYTWKNKRRKNAFLFIHFYLLGHIPQWKSCTRPSSSIQDERIPWNAIELDHFCRLDQPDICREGHRIARLVRRGSP